LIIKKIKLDKTNYMNPLFDLFENDFKEMAAWNPAVIEPINTTPDLLKKLFSCIDLTTLNTTDSSNKVEDFCEKVLNFPSHFPDMPNVAAVCVYPVFASIPSAFLKTSEVQRAVVSAGFPSSQTFLDVKVLETKRALFLGANEVDIVISVGEFLEGNYEFVSEEIRAIKSIMGDAHLKVILETGALSTPENIWNASLVAMEAGADFIKTSTGKMPVSATPEAAWVMTHAIKAFEKNSQKKIGFKAAGGIVTVADAKLYWGIVDKVLGEEWLNSQHFRIGASRLANNILTEIESLSGSDKVIGYF
jgi:deoxyribose-phosphate aldolase